jgi:hypothetical protein
MANPPSIYTTVHNAGHSWRVVRWFPASHRASKTDVSLPFYDKKEAIKHLEHLRSTRTQYKEHYKLQYRFLPAWKLTED